MEQLRKYLEEKKMQGFFEADDIENKEDIITRDCHQSGTE